MDSAYGTDVDSNIIMRNNEDLLEEEEDHEHDDQEEESQLPGFRFYPTDEELVDFYLRRKVENKPFTLDLIKDIDIYKYDPWDLPKSSTVGDNEWYFFCKRGRKYRNSVRPNRVTGSGFWKATGIDKPIRSSNNDIIVGLKKSLVYYVGNAGKGNKTDWMMHEFRLPAPQDFITHNSPPTVTFLNDMDTTQEAFFQEVWTVCRIFKRNVPSRKYTSNWREISTKRSHSSTSTGSMGADVVLGSNSSSDQQVCSRTRNKSTIKGEGNFTSFSNNIPASNDNPQPQAVAILQNPNYDYYSNTSSHHDRPPTTFPAGFVEHEHFGYSSNYYEPLPRTHTSTMDQETPVDQRPGSSSSFYPHKSSVSPMDISSYQGNSSDQLSGTQESWDELRQFWSSFQDQ